MILVFGCFAIQFAYAQPVSAEVLNGYISGVSILTNQEQLHIAIGIPGATIMPHNRTCTPRSCSPAHMARGRQRSGRRSASLPSTARWRCCHAG